MPPQAQSTAKREKRTDFSPAEIESRERRKQATRERIIAAARTAFLSEGYSISLEEIARRAEVGRTSVFNLFESKQQLFTVIMELVFQDLLEGIEHVPKDLPLEETLFHYGKVYVGMSTNSEAIAVTRVSLTEALSGLEIGRMAYQAGRVRSVDRLAVVLQQHMDRGEIRVEDPAWLAECFFAAAVGQSRVRLFFNIPLDGEAELDESLRKTVALFVRGMRV